MPQESNKVYSLSQPTSVTDFCSYGVPHFSPVATVGSCSMNVHSVDFHYLNNGI